MQPLHSSDPERIGPYHLTHRLGAGGMGMVYLAHTPAGRKIVVKVIHTHLQDPGFRARFAREAEAASRVGGFHTAQVVEADPNADLPWIATSYIPGPSLAQAVHHHGPLGVPALRVLTAGLAEGLKAIHEHDLVHRDLKPGNIVLAEDGPRIIDFGIARPLNATSMSTGKLFGTPAYMSPEQAKALPVGATSDIFSLGTVLCYAATGTNPFAASDAYAVLLRVVGEPPTPEGLPADLTQLVTECWNHAPDQRPTAAGLLARFSVDDLENAWPPHRVTVSDSDEAPTRTTRVAKPVPTTKRITLATHPEPSVPARAEKLTPTTAERWKSAEASVRSLSGHRGWVYTAAFSPDGTTLATGGEKNAVHVWDVRTGRPVTTLTDHPGSVRAVAFSPDGAVLTTGSGLTVRIWDLRTGQFITTISENTGGVTSVAFSPDGTTLATSGGTARLRDVHTGELITTLEEEDEEDQFEVTSVAFSPDGTTLATASGWTVRIWDLRTGRPITTIRNPGLSTVASVAFSPDGSTLATGSEYRAVRIWDARTGRPMAVLTHQSLLNVAASVARDSGDTARTSVAFSPDGTVLATGCDRSAHIWDVDTGQLITTLKHPGWLNAVTSVTFSPDGTTLATTSQDRTARLWTVS